MKWKKLVNKNASDMYYLIIWLTIIWLWTSKIKKRCKHNFSDLVFDRYNYNNWFDNPNYKTLKGENEEIKFHDLPYAPPEDDK